MRSIRILTSGLAAFALTATAFAQGGAATAPATSTKPANTVTKPAPTASARGTLTAVDTAANSITLKNGKHEWTFTLASNAVIHEGSKPITAADLVNDKGREVKVRYSESGGTKSAQSVMVAAAKTGKPAAS